MPDPQTPDGQNPYVSPTVVGPATTPAPVVRTNTSWPSVLGIISCVLGGFGVLTGLYGIVWTLFFVDTFADAMKQANPQGAAAFEGINQFRTPMVGFAVLGLILGGWLLVGGIGLLKRRGWGAKAMVLWAVGKMLYGVGYGVLNFRMQQVQFDAMAADPNMPAQFDMATFGTVVAAVSMVVFVVWTWALPLFVLIWMGRKPIKAEVEMWNDNATANATA